MEKISMTTIKAVNKTNGYQWFAPSTMRFFKSKVETDAYKVGNKAYFISSEQFVDLVHGITAPRLFTIRICDLIDGRIDTVGNFQGFKTRQQAKSEIMAIIGEK